MKQVSFWISSGGGGGGNHFCDHDQRQIQICRFRCVLDANLIMPGPFSPNQLMTYFNAIQNSKVLSFTCEKYWTTEKSQRVFEPYALKEFHHRWYLLSNEFRSEKLFIKTFALDRISDFEIKNSSFQKQ